MPLKLLLSRYGVFIACLLLPGLAGASSTGNGTLDLTGSAVGYGGCGCARLGLYQQYHSAAVRSGKLPLIAISAAHGSPGIPARVAMPLLRPGTPPPGRDFFPACVLEPVS
jgi:hypothetical protein